MKNKIKVGSRWKATGRNLARFEIEVIKVVENKNILDHVHYKILHSGEIVWVNLLFFGENFTPIEENLPCLNCDFDNHTGFNQVGMISEAVNSCKKCEPIKEKTTRDFKAGDKVSFVFENAEIVDFETDKPDSNIEVRLSTLGTYTIARKEVIDHKPTKLTLEVGQVWIDTNDNEKATIEIIKQGRACVWFHEKKFFYDYPVDSFTKRFKKEEDLIK